MKQYPITFWYGIRPEFLSKERLLEAKEAGFNIIECIYDPETNKKVLRWCEELGLKANVGDPRIGQALAGEEGWEALLDAGFRSTQATISRDIKELRIVKELTSFGTYRYTAVTDELGGTFSSKLNTIFRECITGFDYAQNMVVIKTMPGLASAAASAIDAMNMSVVLGTIAGDDTVFIVMRDDNSASAFVGEIRNLLN